MPRKKSKCQSDTSEIPRHVVITFVKSLEKAEQYFELKDHIRGQEQLEDHIRRRDDFQHYHCVPKELRNEILEEAKSVGRFEMLEEKDILYAADTLHRELAYAHASEIAPMYIRKQEFRRTKRTEISEEEMDKLIREEFTILWNKWDDPSEMDFFIRSDPLYYLVYQIRAKGFVLNPNPKVELKQLHKKFPFYYYPFFLAEGSKYKARIVTFKCVDCGDIAKFLKLLLSDCGEIASVEITSLDKQSQLAHVTFGDVTAADEALCFAATGFLGKGHLIGDSLIDMIPFPYHELPWAASGRIKPEEVKAAKSYAQNIENELYEHAVNWYRHFYEKVNASKPEGSKRTKKSKARKARRRAEARENAMATLQPSNP